MKRKTVFLFLILAALLDPRCASAQAPPQSTTGPIPPATVESAPLRAPALAGSSVLLNVPAYIWDDGCGPTALGMVLGYWDRSYTWLIPGDATTQTAAVDQVLSSSGSYLDYALPLDSAPYLLPDKSVENVPVHSDNSLADFMHTSRSLYGNYYGWSWFSDIPTAAQQYFASVAPGGYAIAAAYQIMALGTLTWDSYRREIDAGRPVILALDSNGDGVTDHFAPGIGYDSAGDFAILNTWDRSVHWYAFHGLQGGAPWGIYGDITLQITPLVPATYYLWLPLVAK